MEAKRKRLTLDLDPPVQRRLKAVAAIKGISMRQYCLTAITRELSKGRGPRDHRPPLRARSSGPSGYSPEGDIR